ncbi:macrolide transport system ATP-binding/permease protein [Leucobacter luti]|uniref:Macrolide transport system ATP-binding/permease protein n=2 Tax=Leucobacter luti TaxID=340320 RepID=A0A4R6S695_9MICO|nr:macrolide transport system ATP-binding/permease protein [Leucobacter luti]
MTRTSHPQSTPAPARSPSHRACMIRSGTVRFADRTVLSDISLTVGPTDRIAVLGDNAAGKSTLLGVLAGTIPLSMGERNVVLPGGLALAEQRPEFAAGATVAEAIDQVLHEIRALEAAIVEITDRLTTALPAEQPRLLEALATAVDRRDARGGEAVEHQLDIALEQLSLGRLTRSRRVDTLSGGERARLALAAALTSGAELLLLDEPTNDLDDAGITWLEQRLAQHRGAVVAVTHDRAFLDHFAADIVSLACGGLRRTGNGYAGYLTARESEQRRIAAAHETWLQDLARSEDLVSGNAFRLAAIPRKQEKSGFGHGAFRARNRDHGAMSRIRQAKQQITQLRANPAPPPREPLRFAPEFTGAQPGADAMIVPEHESEEAPLLIRAKGLRLGMNGGPRQELRELELRAGERWLISGPNGAGKTTLLRTLAGEIHPARGDVWRRSELRIAWLRQELAAAGELSLCESFATQTQQHLVDAAERLFTLGLFPPEDFERRVGTLSTGQRRRLELAVAVAAPCDVLFLDEPTNHLAPDLVEELERALQDFPGLVVTVTHDRRWREHSAAAGPIHQLELP